MMRKKPRGFYIIVAIDEQGGIGKDNKLPWHIPSEMAHFKYITTTAISRKYNAVIMGRNTWESIPEKFRPLSNRLNIVLTRDEHYVADGAVCLSSLDAAIAHCADDKNVDDIFVIGGAQLYREAAFHPDCEAIFLTIVKGQYDCDTFFPKLERCWIRVAYKAEPGWTGTVYERVKK